MVNLDSLPKKQEPTGEVESVPLSVTINLSRGGEYSIDPIQATPLEVKGGDGTANVKMTRYATVELAPQLESKITDDQGSAIVDVWVATLGGQSRTLVAPRSVDLGDPTSAAQVWFWKRMRVSS